MRHVAIQASAKRDLIDHYARIALDKVAPAERLLMVARESFERLAATPGIGRAWESRNAKLSGVRVYPLPHGYRSYLVFYRPTSAGVEIIRVLHAARDVAAVLDAMFTEPGE
jgi:toxin ParE1/3/4